MSIRFGVTLPNLGVGPDPMTLVELTVEAEDAGWDGVFIWDASGPIGTDETVGVSHDVWPVLGLMAARTNRVLLGTMITPLPWREPWLISKQSTTIQHISRGRFVLAVGLGAAEANKRDPFGAESDRRTRARMLDEGLEVMSGLWTGESFSFEGEHYVVREARMLPATAPRVPVWVVGAWNTDANAWPAKRSLRRAMRWEGVLPNIFRPDGQTFDATPEELRGMVDWIRSERSDPFDVIWEGGPQTDENASADDVRVWRDAGATWWLEAVWWSMYRHPGNPGPMLERIRKGPPRL